MSDGREVAGARRASWRWRLLQIFLWMSVLGWGIGLGAKVFDLVVLAGAWGAAPPGSLSLMPYGPRFPTDPGDFFQPLSVLMLVGVVGALISGWKTRHEYRLWLLLPALMFLIIWALTPTVFWPMIRELYGAGSGRISRSDAELIRLVRRWVTYDWLRVAMIGVGFASYVRAISLASVGNGSSDQRVA
jgi:Domain of unknown function (DUF1772)